MLDFWCMRYLFPLQENPCDETEAPPDIAAWLDSNTYDEAEHAVHFDRTNDPLSPEAETLINNERILFKIETQEAEVMYNVTSPAEVDLIPSPEQVHSPVQDRTLANICPNKFDKRASSGRKKNKVIISKQDFLGKMLLYKG